MPILSSADHISAEFGRIVRIALGEIDHKAKPLTSFTEEGLLGFRVDTSRIHASGECLGIVSKLLKEALGEEAAVKLEIPNQHAVDIALNIHPTYQLTLKVPDKFDVVKKLSDLRREFTAITHCQQKLMRDPGAQLEYLFEHVGAERGLEAFKMINGDIEMSLEHRSLQPNPAPVLSGYAKSESKGLGAPSLAEDSRWVL